MARIRIPEGEGPEQLRVYGMQPELGRALANVSGKIYGKINLSPRIREAARMRIAQLNRCELCLGYRFPELAEHGIDETFYAEVENWQNSTLFNDREKQAIDYADKFVRNDTALDDDYFKQMHALFSDEEIFELSCIIAGIMANGRIMHVLKVDQSCGLSFD
ncbi:MAG: carboxymuconolactone decarboxylase family protein [Pseudomonadales bacterium]|nr:carboxymuconolactone decarboxylase family protein [Pseudomonadales bacterium]